jgi:hypothetical protein
MLRSLIAVAAAAVLCMPLRAWNGPKQTAASASLPADTPRTTPAGTQFIAPAGWTIHVRPPVVVLDPPEPGSHVVLVDVTAKDADAAGCGGLGSLRSSANLALEDGCRWVAAR